MGLSSSSAVGMRVMSNANGLWRGMLPCLSPPAFLFGVSVILVSHPLSGFLVGKIC